VGEGQAVRHAALELVEAPGAQQQLRQVGVAARRLLVVAPRMISAQAGVLDNLRARAGTLIAVASLVTSFLGGQALAKPTLTNGALVRQDIETWGVAAITAFVLVAVMALATLWPYKWRFDMSAALILSSPAEYEPAVADLAKYHETNHASNAKTLDRLFWCLRFGCVFLVVETITWVFDLSR
jgi:hypothetical protein